MTRIGKRELAAGSIYSKEMTYVVSVSKLKVI